MITKFGCPLEFVIDQGSHFINDTIKVLTQEFMILHRKSTTYYPQANRQAESTNKVIKIALTKMVNANRTDWDTKLHAPLWAYRTAYKVTTKHTPFSLVFGTEALLPMAYLHPDVYQQRSQDVHPILAKKMEQLRSMDLTRHEAEENMKHMQLLRKERHDKPRTKTTCNQCKHGTTKPSRKKAKKCDTLGEGTLQATEANKGSLVNDERELSATPKVRFYPGQRILWHLRHKIPGPGKFKIRWAGPYLIKQVYDNGSVDVTTLQGDSLGRVNMNKLKPYHEPETTQAYALQILACHLLETELKKERNHLPKRGTITQSPTTPSKDTITTHTDPTSHPDQATLDAEDLEVHRVMLEVYWAQPITVEHHRLTHMGNEEVRLPRENNVTPNHPCNTFDNPKQTHIEFPKENANLTYPTRLIIGKGRTDHHSK